MYDQVSKKSFNPSLSHLSFARNNSIARKSLVLSFQKIV